MKIKEISYTYRVTMPGSQYDYEIVSATASLDEVDELDGIGEAYSRLRQEVITQTTKFKLKEKENGNN